MHSLSEMLIELQACGLSQEYVLEDLDRMLNVDNIPSALNSADWYVIAPRNKLQKLFLLRCCECRQNILG